jgi:hypothetical protein
MRAGIESSIFDVVAAIVTCLMEGQLGSHSKNKKMCRGVALEGHTSSGDGWTRRNKGE